MHMQSAAHSGSRTSQDEFSTERLSKLQTRYPHATPGVCSFYHDTQTGMLPGYPESAICVQRFDDSLSSAIHITYRNWLRSSSMHERRDPPLEVVISFSDSTLHFSKRISRREWTRTGINKYG